MGTNELKTYAAKYNIKLKKKEHPNLKFAAKKGWKKFINDKNKMLCHEDALDLLSKLLVYDHESRLTCEEAMQHKYFEPIRYELKVKAEKEAAATKKEKIKLISGGGETGEIGENSGGNGEFAFKLIRENVVAENDGNIDN